MYSSCHPNDLRANRRAGRRQALDIFDWTHLDWSSDGPWLTVLLLLVSGVVLPVLLYNLFDHWASRRLRLDSVALATRYGGFMNSWAVFGRHAGEYRDLRPLFPEAQAAELARFHDNTATIAARFRSARAAAAAAEQRFGSFAAAGVEYADAGISFQAGSGRPGEGRSPYARGQWLVIGDTLFAFYAPDSHALARRRQATPALRARRFPGPLRLLHSRTGHFCLMLLWAAAHLAVASRMLEATAARSAGAAAPVAEAELRERLTLLEEYRDRVKVVLLGEPGDFMLAERPDDLRSMDLDRLAGRAWLTGLQLDFDTQQNGVRALILISRVGETAGSNSAANAPARWHNNLLLVEPDDPLLRAVRETVLKAGWSWQPALWPLLPEWPASDATSSTSGRSRPS